MFGAKTFGCTRCPALCATRSRIVDGDGPDQAPILGICEAPGFEEDRRGKPLVGRSGRLMRSTMAELGASADLVRWTNAIRCWPGEGNRTPTKIEVIECSGWLIAEILECQPKVILALGKVAQLAVAYLKDAIKAELPNVIIVETWHPAYLLRSPKMRPRWEDDLKRAINLAEVGPFGYQPKELVIAEPWVEGEPNWDAPILGIDTETDNGEEHWSSQMVTWQISDGERARTYTDPYYWDFMIQDKGAAFQEFWRQHGSPKLTLWNAKFDAPVLGLDLWNFDSWDDAEIASYILRRPAGLKDYASEYLGLPMHKIQELIGTGKKRIPYSVALTQQPTKAETYGNRDAVATARAGQTLLTELAETPSLWTYYKNIEQPTAAALLDMEQAGIMVDADRLQALGDTLTERMEKVKYELIDKFEIYKPGSTHELAIMFDRMGIKTHGKTANGAPKLDKPAMAILRQQELDLGKLDHVACIDAVMEYRVTQKIKSTYVLPLLSHRDAFGRVHARFNQTVTDTNRLSSSNPNLQNIPSGGKMGDIGKEMRRSFIARPGYVLVVGDYGQLELRLFAEYTQDPLLIAAFADPTKDVHQIVADEIMLSRYTTKTLEYAILYGADKPKIAEVAGARDKLEAERILAIIGSKMPSLLGWREFIEKELASKGYIESLFGWKNYYPLYFSPLPTEQSASVREAANMPMQGTAAGLVKIAMREGRPVAQKYDAQLLLQVHDELIYEVPEKAASEFAREMSIVGQECGKPTIQVPLIFECAQGSNWVDAKGEH